MANSTTRKQINVLIVDDEESQRAPLVAMLDAWGYQAQVAGDGQEALEKLATFSEHFSPRTVAQFNDCDVMVTKLKGEFIWHKHDDTDDFFLVLKGVLTSFEIEQSPLGRGKCTWCLRALSTAQSRKKKCICF